MLKILLSFFFLFNFQNCFAQNSFFLECNGSRWSEVDNKTTKKESAIETYEIKDEKLVFTLRDQKIFLAPDLFDERKINYFAAKKPFMDMVQNYYLQFDRISGSVTEQSDMFDILKRKSFGYDKFEGICRKVTKKF
jgi:hypothetical protein